MMHYEQALDANAPSAATRLLRGLARAEAGRREDAAEDARTVLKESHHALRAAHLLFIADEPGESVDALKALDTPVARRMRLRFATSLGWNLDALETVRTGLQAGDPALPLHIEAFRIHASAHCKVEALHHAREALALHPEHDSLRMGIASLLARDGDQGERHDAVQLLEGLRDTRAHFHLEAGRALLWCREGDDDRRADDAFRRAEDDPTLGAEASAELAHAAFERGDDQEASERAKRSLARGECALARTVLGALAWTQDARDEAETQLRRALEVDAHDGLAQSWLAELYMHVGHDEAARNVLHVMRTNPDGFLFVNAVQRLLVSIRTRERNSPVTESERFREIRDGLRHYAGDEGEAVMAAGQQQEVEELLVRVLKQIGRARRIPPPALRSIGARKRARRALMRIEALGETALKAFDDALVDLRNDALVRCHRGELALWLGRFDEGEADLRASIAMHGQTRWAYIGLSALELVRGDPEACLRWNERGITAMGDTKGAAVFVHEGEALRRLGKHNAAKEALQTAIRLHPARLSAHLNAALLDGCDGTLRLRAPGLWSDARRELRQEGEEPSEEHILERALMMMGANRSSSCINYWTKTSFGRKLRFVPLGGAPPLFERESGRLRARLGLHPKLKQ